MMSAVDLNKSAVAAGLGRLGSSSLSEVEVEVIDLFVQAAHLLNLPKSIGEIYGFLFVCPAAVASEEIVSKLKISKGAASHGLKHLRTIGAVKLTYVMGERRDHYVVETDLRKLAAGFLREQIERHLVNGQERLARLEDRLATFPSHNREFLDTRVQQLKSWSAKARAILPVVMAFLGANNDNHET